MVEALEKGAKYVQSQRQQRHQNDGVLTVNFEHVSLFLVFLLLTLNR